MFDWSQLSFSAILTGLMGLSIWSSGRPPQRRDGFIAGSNQEPRYDYLKEIEHGSFNLPRGL